MARLFAITIFYIFISGIFALILLIPAYILSVSKEEFASSRLEVLKKSVNYRASTDIEKTLDKTNDDIKEVANFTDKYFIEDHISFILNARKNGVRINNLGYRKIDESHSEISLSGISDSRDSLLLYVETLKSNESFGEIDLPISNLAKERDIDFSLKFQAEMKQK